MKTAEQSHCTDDLHLTVAIGYLKRLRANRKDERYLRNSHSDIVEGL